MSLVLVCQYDHGYMVNVMVTLYILFESSQNRADLDRKETTIGSVYTLNDFKPLGGMLC